MKARALTIILALVSLFTLAQNKQSIHGFTATTINEDVISLGKYLGKKILLVNTASYCAYTPQFEKLQQLYSTYKQQGFEVIGFPCNDFGSQDPKSDSLINIFCVENYSVTFQMMSKIEIAKGDTSPIYKWLQRANLNGVKNVSVDWNFNKFLINECGHWVARFPSQTSPMDTVITNWISRPACDYNPVAVNENSFNNNLLEYHPANPVRSQLQLKAQAPVEVLIMRAEGKLVDRFQITDPSQVFNYDVSQWPAGLYFLKIYNAQSMQNIKIVVME